MIDQSDCISYEIQLVFIFHPYTTEFQDIKIHLYFLAFLENTNMFLCFLRKIRHDKGKLMC